MFEYLTSVMGNWRRFNPHTMEQSLLNYAFRRGGADAVVRIRVGVECYMAEFEGLGGRCKEPAREMGSYGAGRVKREVAESEERDGDFSTEEQGVIASKRDFTRAGNVMRVDGGDLG